MEKKIIDFEDYIQVKYRCEKCRNHYEGVMRKGAGSVRLTCSYCGNAIVVFV